MHFITTKKKIIEEFAQEIAEIQRRADVCYYEKGNQEQSAYLLDRASGLKKFAGRLGICGAVYKRAYGIYDFRNSAKNGFTLKDGRIVRVADHGTD